MHSGSTFGPVAGAEGQGRHARVGAVVSGREECSTPLGLCPLDRVRRRGRVGRNGGTILAGSEIGPGVFRVPGGVDPPWRVVAVEPGRGRIAAPLGPMIGRASNG